MHSVTNRQTDDSIIPIALILRAVRSAKMGTKPSSGYRRTTDDRLDKIQFLRPNELFGYAYHKELLNQNYKCFSVIVLRVLR